MGEVHLAREERTGDLVALKTVAAERIPIFGLLREIHALSRIRHPAIARILASGVDAGVPWYAMRLEHGPTLGDVLGLARRRGAVASGARRPSAEWWTRTLAAAMAGGDSGNAGATRQARSRRSPGPPAALSGEPPARRRTLDVFRRLCATLAYLHGEGLVHRDLKPDNVIVREDDVPVIVDFGLAVSFRHEGGREVLEEDPTLSMGTLTCIAPEQIRGELADARADLYAVGCMLHLAIAHAPPFLGTTQEVVNGHLARRPASLADRIPGVAPILARLVDALLEKRPEDRPGRADDVARVLVEAGADPDLPPGWPPARSALYRPQLQGREDEFARLESFVEAAAGGRGGVVVVSGESGAGKTRLVLEAARRAERSGFRVLVGECAPDEADHEGAPLGALRRPLATVVQLCDLHPEMAPRVLHGRGHVLSRVEPAAARHAGSPAVEPAALSAADQEARLFDAVTSLLQALAAGAPVLLAIEDVQWADDETRRLVDRMAAGGSLAGSRALVVATARIEGSGAPSRALSPDIPSIALGRLSETHVRAILRGMLAGEPPDGLTEAVARHCGGNPYFAVELLRAAVEEDLVTRGEDGRWRSRGGTIAELPLPRSLRELERRRLAGASTGARDIAEWLAIVGRECPAQLLEELVGTGEADMHASIAELLGRGALLEGSSGALSLAHHALRETLLEGLDEGRSQALHGAVARALTEREAGAQSAAERAAHWEAAGEPEAACDAWLVAARHARDVAGKDHAARLYARHLALAPAGPLRDAAAGERASCLVEAGHVDEALAGIDTLLASARERGDEAAEASLCATRAEALYVLGRFADARAACARAQDLCEAHADRRGIAQCLGRQSAIAYAEGDVSGGRDLARRASDVQREIGDVAGLAETLSRLCVQHRDLGELAESRAAGEEALERARQVGLPRVEAVTLSRLAFLSRQQGRPARCVALSDEAIVLHRRQGDAFWRAVAAGNRAIALADLGRHEEAELGFEEALRILEDMSEGHWIGVIQAHVGLMRHDLGLIDEGRALLQRALDTLQRSGDGHWAAVAEAYLAGVELDAGAVDAATIRVERAAGELERRRDGAHLLAALACAARVALVGRGEPEAAEEHVARAERLANSLDHEIGRGLAAVLRGHLDLARGRSARRSIERARRSVRATAVTADGALARALRDLEDAAAAPAGDLRRGVLPSSLRAPLRRLVLSG